MSHHSTEESLAALAGTEADASKRIGDLLTKKHAAEEQIADTLGPTKDYPHGKLVPHDEGGLVFGVTVFNGRVVFDFGKPIRSIGFTREGALQLAELIKQRAEQCPAIFAPAK